MLAEPIIGWFKVKGDWKLHISVRRIPREL